MNERSRNIAVGLTVFVGICGLLVMMLLFGYVPGWLERTYSVEVHLPHSDGLAQSSPVRLHGISVGTVVAVKLAQLPRTGVVATANIRQNVRLPESVYATVESPFFGGSTNLELTIPAPVDADIAYLPTDGTAQIAGQRASLVGALANEMRAAIEQPLSDFERIADQIELISQEWSAVGRNVNHLLEPRHPDQIEANDVPANLNTLIQRTDARLAQMENVLAGLERYTTDEQFHEDLRHTAANTRRLTEQLPRQIDELSGNVNQSVVALRSRYIALADDLSGAITAMQRVAERAEHGEGTVGRLLNDPSLYNNLDDTVERMQHTLDDLRLLIQKWQAEGVPIQF